MKMFKEPEIEVVIIESEETMLKVSTGDSGESL